MPSKKNPQKVPHLKFEEEASRLGFNRIAGIDEVGRGCLAGPVVAAAVILPHGEAFDGVRDSKCLSPHKREKLCTGIKERAVCFGLGLVSADEIDKINIVQATFKAMRLALRSMAVEPDYLLIDGRAALEGVGIPQRAIIGGDNLSLSIAAASIVAKVFRDRLMADYMCHYPAFCFSTHKGYGTSRHLEEIERFGPTPIHRKSFAGVLPQKNLFTHFKKS